MGKNIMYNDSGCIDRTAGEAISHMLADEKDVDRQARKSIKEIKLILENAGFRLLTRIQMEHIKSGKKYL